MGGGQDNTAIANRATVSGGGGNVASGDHSTVGGGDGNTASGGFSSVGGGTSNDASGSLATVAGGLDNTGSGTRSTVSGGENNLASGSFSTVAGGRGNKAQGSFSFAAGREANAIHSGAFVWADNSGAGNFLSLAINEFNVRAAGGTRIYSNPSATVGAWLSPGASAWSAFSDRAVKENLVSIDPLDVLDRLSRVPIDEWNLISQDPSIRHMGPMAQDFHAAFGLGESNRHISTTDADGVALAAIQGLYAIVQEKDAEITALQEQLVQLEARLAALEGK